MLFVAFCFTVTITIVYIKYCSGYFTDCTLFNYISYWHNMYDRKFVNNVFLFKLYLKKKKIFARLYIGGRKGIYIYFIPNTKCLVGAMGKYEHQES